ncbi:deoxyribonuclease V [bacterium]|nr:deoxyribonuclease V [bacterium]
MKIREGIRHRWDVSPRQAIEIQEDLRSLLVLTNGFDKLLLVGGADVAYSRKKNRVCAALTVFHYSTMNLLDVAYAEAEASFPYIPGLLTFREGPVVLKAFRRLKERPDLIIFDGQGIAHPRRLGLAAHMGLVLNMPTVGCAKSPLRVQFEVPGLKRGSASKMMDGEEQVGVVLRTRDGIKPLYISPGHLVDLATSVKVILATGRGYRLPQPTRIAHIKVTEFRKRFEM